tara:strand:+ start:1636 stop:2124 length:489 start_codon:yes stop_codon:yes gene_type:complete
MMAPHTALTMRASIAARPTATTTTTKTTGAKRGALQVVGAASKAKKNRDLDRLRDLASAEETLLVAGFNYQGLTVRFVIRVNARAGATDAWGGAVTAPARGRSGSRSARFANARAGRRDDDGEWKRARTVGNIFHDRARRCRRVRTRARAVAETMTRTPWGG